MSERAGRAARAALVAALVLAGAAGAEDLGRRIYHERCTACHGEDGRGDGPVAAALQPPPRNFRDPTFWAARNLADVRRAVRDGRPGTLMQAFGTVLSDAEIEAVVRYLTTFRPAEAAGHATGRDGEVSGAGAREDAAGGTDRH
jgi:mono/diheme cytochrome c family protein